MTDELPDEQLEDLHAKREQLLARLHAVQARGRYAHEKSWGTLREERMVEGLQVLEGKMLWELRGLDQRIRDLAAKADATFTERDFIFKGEWDWFMGRVREFWNGLPREEDSRRVLRLFAHGAPVAVIDQLQTVAPGRIRLRVRSPEAAPAVEKFWAALRRNADILEEIEVTVLAPVWTFSGGWDYFVKDWRAAAAQVDLSCWLDKERDELTMDTPTGREATLTAGARTDAATQLYWEVAAHDWAEMNGMNGKVAAIVAMLRRRGWVVDTQADATPGKKKVKGKVKGKVKPRGAYPSTIWAYEQEKAGRDPKSFVEEWEVRLATDTGKIDAPVADALSSLRKAIAGEKKRREEE